MIHKSQYLNNTIGLIQLFYSEFFAARFCNMQPIAYLPRRVPFGQYDNIGLILFA